MLKGINRNVLIVRADKDSSFEIAYFIMKHGFSCDRSDILKEAATIISGAGSGRTQRARRKLIGIGAVCLAAGALLSSLIWIIFILL